MSNSPSVALVFQAHNGNYLSVINGPGPSGQGSQMYIEAAKSSIDNWCRFSVVPQSATQIALQDTEGKYLSVIQFDTNGPLLLAVSNKTTPDAWCTFNVTKQGGENDINLIALEVDANGTYLSGTDYGNGTIYIAAGKRSIDEWCIFSVTTLLD